MYGIDISSWQDAIDLSAGQYDFAIIKATEGTNYIDPSFEKFSVQLTELGKLIGCYHFARPDLHGSVVGMETEADWFISTVEKAGLLGKAILVLDWETEPMDREDLINAFILRVEERTGITPFIYSSKSKLSSWKNWWAIDHCPIWMAAWPSITKPPVGVDPSLTNPNELVWWDISAFKKPDKTVNWVIWQYSSTGIYPNYNGNIDLDYCELTVGEWKKLAGMKKEPVEVPEVITEDMEWAIDNGLFAGYGNGKYGPKDPLTREQAATILRRYDEKLMEMFEQELPFK